LTLVVGVTSGAVAGALITSSDIKDDTIRSRDIMDNAIQSRDIKSDTIRNSDIRAGAVNWDKSLDDETKELIEGLAQSGAAGPPGAPGPAGAPGAAGSAGADGADGDGTLAAWSRYDTESGDSAPLTIANPLDDPTDPDDDADFPPLDVDLVGLEPAGGEVHLEPGSYLVTLRSLSSTLGVWVPQLSSATDLDGPTPSMGVCLSLFLPCQTTFPVVVGAGGADLELYLGDIGSICSCTTAPPLASLSAVALATGSGVTAPTTAPELDDVVNGLVTQIVGLIEGIGMDPLDAPFRSSMRQLQRHYVR
jgi:hypothetical protein